MHYSHLDSGSVTKLGWRCVGRSLWWKWRVASPQLYDNKSSQQQQPEHRPRRRAHSVLCSSWRPVKVRTKTSTGDLMCGEMCVPAYNNIQCNASEQWRSLRYHITKSPVVLKVRHPFPYMNLNRNLGFEGLYLFLDAISISIVGSVGRSQSQSQIICNSRSYNVILKQSEWNRLV